MLKVSSTDKDKIKHGDTHLLTEVVSKELEAAQLILNVIREDQRYHQGILKSLSDILNILK